MKDETSRMAWRDRANQGMRITTTLSFNEVQKLFNDVVQNWKVNLGEIRVDEEKTNNLIHFEFKATLRTGILAPASPEVDIVHDEVNKLVHIYLTNAVFTQSKTLGFIPTGPKTMNGRPYYTDFLDIFSDRIIAKDASAKAEYTTETNFS